MIYVIWATLIMVLGFIALFLIYTLPLKSAARVKIYIPADSQDETEKAIMNTYYFCARYFKNAEIYVYGDDEKYLDILIRAYSFLRRDDRRHEHPERRGHS